MLTLNEIKDELEMLCYTDRIQRMLALGRDPENEPLLAEMEQNAFDMRWLALMSCHTSRDGARVLRLLGDSSQLIRHSAASLVALIGTTTQGISALDMILPRYRRRLVCQLQKRNRPDVLDACLQHLAGQTAENKNSADKTADSKDNGLIDCLPHGTAETVRALLPQVLPYFASHHWIRLARLHPVIALEVLQERAEEADRSDAGLVYHANWVLPVTAEPCPNETLALVRTLIRHVPLDRLAIQHLAFWLPVEVTDLILASEVSPTVLLPRLLPRLDADRAIALLEHYHSQFYALSTVFRRRLSPAVRDRLYVHFSRGWENREGCIDPFIVALLSPQHREREARRHLNLPSIAARPAQCLPYAAYLPWEEAQETLAPYLRDPDPQLRVLAHTTLTVAVRYHRDRLPALLALQTARKNEQDPVRNAMLTGIAALPPGIWRPTHLDTLAQLLRNALDAADLSAMTAQAMVRLVAQLLPFYPHWCADWLATLARERGTLIIPALENRLSDKEVRVLAPVLLPVLHSWENQEGWGSLYAVANSLGRRLRVFDAMLVMLERIVQIPAAMFLSLSALNLLAKHGRKRLETLIPALLEADPSWATRPVAYLFLHRKRQDLLTPFLGFQVYAGRFTTGKTRLILPFAQGFVRWTARQQQLFADVLAQVTEETGRDTPGYLQVMKQLAVLPAPPPTCLIALAQLDNPKPAMRDAALRALGTLDGGQGIATLLDALDDARARIAIYALRHALLEMPKDRALALLKNVPMAKVTVAKEVIRLLGELKTEAAYQELTALNGRDDLHRDVRIALLRALWAFLKRPQTWEVLEQAAVSPDAAIATHVSRVPSEGLAPAMQQRLIGVLALLLKHPSDRVRLDTLNRCATLPVTDRAHILLPHFLRSVGARVGDERVAAAGAVCQTYTGRDAALVGETTRTLLASRRALTTFVHVLIQQTGVNRVSLLPTAREVLAVLATDPLTSQLQIRLAVQALPSDEQVAFFREMAASRALHADALQTAMQSLHYLSTGRKDARLEDLEAGLAISEDRYLRRLALGVLIAQATGPTGWTDERTARLNVYRQDPASLVAEAAQFTFPPGED